MTHTITYIDVATDAELEKFADSKGYAVIAVNCKTENEALEATFHAGYCFRDILYIAWIAEDETFSTVAFD